MASSSSRVTRRSRGRVPPARMATLARAGTAPGSAWLRSLLVVVVDGRRLVADEGNEKGRGVRPVGLRGFGGTDEVCLGGPVRLAPPVHAPRRPGGRPGRRRRRQRRRSWSPWRASEAWCRSWPAWRTSPLGPFRPAHGETSIRLVTMGHLLGRHQSLGTRPALDGRSAGRSPTLPGRGRAVKRLSERTSAGRGTSPAATGPGPGDAAPWRCCRRRRRPR